MQHSYGRLLVLYITKSILVQKKKVTYAADNKDTFRRYKGIEILIGMFSVHKSVQVAKALKHVLSGNSKPFLDKLLHLFLINLFVLF